MANIYKRFGAWVTALQSDLFAWARLKLTAIYLLIIVIILTVFSLVLYANVSQHLGHDFSKRSEFFISGSEENPLDTALEKLQTGIVTGDLIVLAVAGGLSYWLAGYTLKPIRRALAAQTQFSAEASHELRTPLAVMRTDIEVLLKSKQQLPQEARLVLESNLEEIKSMSAMTEDLLRLARGTGQILEHPERLNLKDLAAGVVGKLATIAKNQGIKLSLLQSPDVYVIGSRQDLSRMVKNLVINSLNNTNPSGSVEVAVATKNNGVELMVADTGIGIPSKELPRIFEAFYKVKRSSQGVDNREGTGLGLTLVKQIIDQHHGTIKVKSRENQGTTVIIQLPRTY